MPASDATASEQPAVFGVAGLPRVVANSRSPLMFAAAFRERGINGYYVPLAIRERTARKALRSLPRLGFRGANVTMPYKALAAEVAHTRSELVEMTGIANTLVIDAGGQIHAEATDGIAIAALVAEAGRPLRDAVVTVLGAGGAATDAAFAAARGGASLVRVWNRDPERAQALVQTLQSLFPALGLELHEELPIHVPAHVLVSAVPEETFSVPDLAALHEGMVIVDLAYRSDGQPTALMHMAQQQAAVCVDGRAVLVRQGAESFRLWFGVDAPTEVMSRAVT